MAGHIRLAPLIGPRSDLHSSERIVAMVSPPLYAQGLALLVLLSSAYREVGLFVTNVGPNSEAATRGLDRGDVLLRYGGVPLLSGAQLRDLEKAFERRGSVSVDIEAVRGQRELTVSASPGRLGITVSPLLYRMPQPQREAREIVSPRNDDSGATPDALTPLEPEVAVEVPPDLVSQLLLLGANLQPTTPAKHRKKAASLLLAATTVM